MPAIGATGITEGTREAGCGKWDIRAEGIGCRLTTRAVNRNCDWFKTRHSLAIDVRKRMRGQAAPDGDRSRAWQVRRCRRRMGVGVRGLSREPQPGFPVCQRMPVPGRRPRGTPGHSGTQSTGFRAWLTKKMEAANGFGGVVNHTITPLLQRTALNPLHHVAAIRGGMPLPMQTGGMKRGFSAGGPLALLDHD